MILKATIEMPTNTNYKYEIDDQGTLHLDRVLEIKTPANYGFIEHTLAMDGDPLDVFVISKTPIISKSSVNVHILGVIKCIDQGIEDHKLIGTLIGESYFEIELFAQISAINTYLNKYKEGFEVLEIADKEEAEKIYLSSIF